ncbi:N-acetylmuramoyl-L-alanine amidase [Lentibacillus cibarius]|uniref:N-acetylmuramoyl-L-alanine amidase n=1 Tax=Lentibacillus cibarius TaxID=2583219 RepID=UPI002277E637|nr:N-acetylmuramoyl-L-alanine amidase [Lentibacillus cibarius]
MGLSERTSMANAHNADLFVSFHHKPVEEKGSRVIFIQDSAIPKPATFSVSYTHLSWSFMLRIVYGTEAKRSRFFGSSRNRHAGHSAGKLISGFGGGYVAFKAALLCEGISTAIAKSILKAVG